jgi:superoxide dismutase, Fe-Mn family
MHAAASILRHYVLAARSDSRLDYAARASAERGKEPMTTLAFNHEEIVPRPLRPELLELDGISRETVEAHYKLYEGYVNKRNEILGKLADVDLATANQTYSALRGLKVGLTFAIGGIKNHELYFGHLGGHGGDPDGAIGALITRDFGSAAGWRADLKATGIAGRGWAWTAYDWDEGRLFNYIGDAQNTFPVWNATPLVALDVYEHAYFIDYQTDRASYIEAFFNNLDWGVVNDWVSRYGIPA